MKLLFLTLIIANLAFSQKYVVFENNKKNKALFDYNDPNSLVSMLVQNKEKIISQNRFEMISNGNSEYSIHPIDALSSFSVSGEPWSYEVVPDGEFDPVSVTLMRDDDNESFETWLERLTTLGADAQRGPELYQALMSVDPVILKKQYENARGGTYIKFPDNIIYYDLNTIDLIIADSSTIYFAKRSPYENKHFICLKLSLDYLNGLERLDYLSEPLSKIISSKLRDYQIKKRELETSEFPSYSLIQYSALNEQVGLFNSFDENEFKIYEKTSAIKKIFPKGEWKYEVVPEGEDDPVSVALMRDDDNETFDAWLERLTTQGADAQKGPELYQVLMALDLVILKKQYENARGGTIIKYPDLEEIYWVDYPNPSIYLKRNFSKDSIGKFKTNFSQLLFTERMNGKKGFSQKPQVLMSFGEGEEYGAPISLEILDLLKAELAPFNMKKEFAWQKLIATRKGKNLSNDDLKKLIHCYDINENGIEY
ncbi:MAG: hypothetical protein ACOVNZ_08325 [Crocinitomicaceae bacterium]|jgi:hypothetical protein